ncbi:cytochrome c oxidase subunit II [Pseudomonas indica]|uniref:cytochrome c oxidase subunit II n=1 Tax=Pseudomonas indica TaxID=137658 RepID=UPI000BABD66A|nr:cytochrome c oxidase subunit II [Pseudomonas indica]PAU61539.1 cytochrome c oxidase subunit II [Pseudomonas indica]
MAREVTLLWWAMLGFASLVLLGVTALWLYAMHRAPRETSAEQARRINRRWIVGGGLLLPGLSILLLLAFGIPAGHRLLPLPLAEPPLRIEVTGHQWWWEVRYPDGVVTANQLHIPAGRPVDLAVSSADVIHSFWVPRLGGKLDMIPGRRHVLRLQADRPGTYRGQCAEFCGSQHAHMAIHVVAHDEPAFQAWLAARRERRFSPPPGEAGAVFEQRCGRCHRVAGVSEGGRAPDLTDVGSRPSLGAGTLDNRPGALRRWLREHQRLKPGNGMPAHDDVTPETLDRIADWLETLAP